ncbi:MAG: hypothetical protein K0S65_349 [Labilithrix sp.]|nr:hypothetical protein [Labilithrix sp.]
MKLRIFLATAALLAGIVACTGASSTELFAPAGSSQFGTDPGGASSSGEPTTPGSSDLPDPSGDGTSSSSGGSSGTSSSSSSGGSSSGGPKDSGPPPTTPAATIFCGSNDGTTTSCNAGTEVCCGSTIGWGEPSFECEPAGFVACAGAMKIACDDRTDCPTGQVCCGTLEDNSGYTSVECKKTCTSVPGLRAVRFCDPDATVDECAALGQQCENSQSLPGFHVCRN